MSTPTQERMDAIAVIGMAGRFPGADDVDQLWTLLADGREGIARLSHEQLLEAGEDPRALDDERYVPAAGLLRDFDCFDAGFFDFSDREARILDPQFRVFLECAWHALEDAGCDPARFDERIGVFGGSGMNAYLWRHVRGGLFDGPVDDLEARLLNDRDFLTTWTSYRLGLTGPSIGVQTACSTSLVAVHLACQSLLTYEADVALAGGVTIALPQGVGYVRKDGSPMSADGHCRPFDAQGSGLVGGSGAGVVTLRRLADAEAAGDRILGVLLATAVNNDGAAKAGYSAPSVEGQRRVLSDALELAGVEPGSIGYVETHGTGTPIGDPIELRALREAYGGAPGDHCAIGSVKANVGHLDAAAGVASLIKVLLSFEHGEIPPSRYFTEANPLLELDRTPFFVNREPLPWPTDGPCRAAVSSFGMGGTNAHLVVERHTAADAAPARRRHHLVCLSAKSEAALARARARLADHVVAHRDLRLQDVSLTTSRRAALEHRWAVAAATAEELADRLRAATAPVTATDPAPAVAFLFPGQGAQRAGMAAGLYADEPVFARELDRCLAALPGGLDAELRHLLITPRSPDGDERLRQTALAQPALFAVEYALARLWESWGVTAAHLLGHSVGEYVAACLAGVFTVEDAVALVATRGRLMQAMPAGAMLAVSADEAAAGDLLADGVCLAAVNGPGQLVLSGPDEAIAAAEQRAAERGLRAKRLATSHAFHSAMLDPMLAELGAAVAAVARERPTRPFFSNVTGRLITAEEATAPEYWVRQAREPVRFAPALSAMAGPGPIACVEVGPGSALASLARRQLRGQDAFAVTSLSGDHDPRPDGARLLESLGALWAAGVEPAWAAVHDGQGARPVRLPGYAFERTRHWIAAPAAADAPRAAAASPATSEDTAPTAPPSAPVSDTAAVVADVFAAAFGIAGVGEHDSFFELGGNSLVAAEVVDQLRRRFERDVPVRALFDAPRVGELAAFIDAQAEPGGAPADGDDDELSGLVDELSSLPPAELEALLRESGAARS